MEHEPNQEIVEKSFIEEMVEAGEDLEKLYQQGALSEDEYKEFTTSQGTEEESSEDTTQDGKTSETLKAEGDKSPVLPDEREELARDAKNWQNWVNQFGADPVRAIASIVGNPDAFTPDQRNALSQYLGHNPQVEELPEAVDFTSFEPASDIEAAILPYGGWITNGREEVKEAFGTVEANLHQLYIEQQATLGAMKELARLFTDRPIPDLDLNAVYKAKTIGDGIRDTYLSQIRNIVDDALKLQKSKNKEVPTTPRSVGNTTVGYNKPKTIQEALQQVEAAMANAR